MEDVCYERRVLRETTSRCLCGLVCASHTGTREEPGTLTQGDSLFSLELSLGIEPKTPGRLVHHPTTRVAWITVLKSLIRK